LILRRLPPLWLCMAGCLTGGGLRLWLGVGMLRPCSLLLMGIGMLMGGMGGGLSPTFGRLRANRAGPCMPSRFSLRLGPRIGLLRFVTGLGG